MEDRVDEGFFTEAFNSETATMSTGEATSPPQRRFVRYPLTWATYALVGYFAYLETVLGPLMPFLRAEHGFSYTVASLHFSAFALGAMPVGFFGDRVTGRWGRRAGLWGGGAGMAAGALLLAASPLTAGTVLGAFFMGTFGGLLLITTQAVLADKYGEWSAVAITESNAAASACAILASLAVGAFAAAGLGWRAALILPVVALILLAIRFCAEPLGQARTQRSASDSASPALPTRFWVYVGVLFLGVSVAWPRRPRRRSRNPMRRSAIASRAVEAAGGDSHVRNRRLRHRRTALLRILSQTLPS